MSNPLATPIECKIIITLKNGLIFIEGNLGTVEVSRMMLCAAIQKTEEMFQERQGRKVVSPEGLRIVN